MLKSITYLVLILCLAYASFCALMYFLQDALVFHRRPADPALEAEIKRAFPALESLTLTAGDGTTLSGWRLTREAASGKPAPLILYFGGNAEEITWFMAEYAAKLPGYSLAAFNYRGYGASGGKPSEEALKSDALFIAQNLLAPGQPLILIGRSLGTAMALHAAAKLQPCGLILLTPFTSILDLAKEQHPYLPVELFLKHKFLMQPDAKACQAKALFVVSERDEIAPPKYGRTIFEAYAGPKELYPLAGADHNSILEHPDFWPALGKFLQSLNCN